MSWLKRTLKRKSRAQKARRSKRLRTIEHLDERYEFPLGIQPMPSTNAASATLDQAHETLSLAGFQSLNDGCRFNVVIEHFELVKKVAMPRTDRIEVTQRFSGREGDQLSFEFVA